MATQYIKYVKKRENKPFLNYIHGVSILSVNIFRGGREPIGEHCLL